MSTPIYANARAITRMAANAIGGRTQQEVADEFGITRPQISKAVNFDPSEPTRYHALRVRIIERYTDMRVSEEPYWRVESEEAIREREDAPPVYEHLPDG